MSDKCIVNKSTLTGIADAIRAKDGSTGTMLPSEMAEKISDIPTGGGDTVEAAEKDINFYRPDGLRLYSYTAEEVLADGWSMPALPPWSVTWQLSSGPSTIQMAPQDWNYTIDEVLDYASDVGECNIAGMYSPSDGYAHIYYVIDDVDCTESTFSVVRTKVSTTTIDWGDGSPVENITGSANTIQKISHTHPVGSYDIKLYCSDGILNVYGNNSTSNFYGNTYVSTTSNGRITSRRLRGFLSGPNIHARNAAFSNSYSLSLLSFQLNAGTSYWNTYMIFGSTDVRFVGFPRDIKTLQSSGFNASSLEHVSLPAGATSFPDFFMQGCSKLKTLVIPKGITSLGASCLSSCYNLQRVVLPSALTSIGSNAFNSDYSIRCFKFPASLTSISAYAFSNCYEATCFDFSKCSSIVSLANANAFQNVSSSAKMVVPDSLYDDWIGATNWSSSSVVDRIVKASEYFGG